MVVYISCVSNYPTASISGKTTSLWARVLEEEDQMELHFPIALKEVESFIPEDFQYFSVDEPYEIYEGFILKKGDYPVEETESELVIIVDLEPE